MAITWEVKITPIDIGNYIASIEATRTDSSDLDNPMVYKVPRAVIETGLQQVAAMDEIWAKHQFALSENVKVQTFIVQKQLDGKTNLEARE